MRRVRADSARGWTRLEMYTARRLAAVGTDLRVYRYDLTWPSGRLTEVPPYIKGSHYLEPTDEHACFTCCQRDHWLSSQQSTIQCDREALRPIVASLNTLAEHHSGMRRGLLRRLTPVAAAYGGVPLVPLPAFLSHGSVPLCTEHSWTSGTGPACAYTDEQLADKVVIFLSHRWWFRHVERYGRSLDRSVLTDDPLGVLKYRWFCKALRTLVEKERLDIDSCLVYLDLSCAVQDSTARGRHWPASSPPPSPRPYYRWVGVAAPATTLSEGGWAPSSAEAAPAATSPLASPIAGEASEASVPLESRNGFLDFLAPVLMRVTYVICFATDDTGSDDGYYSRAWVRLEMLAPRLLQVGGCAVGATEPDGRQRAARAAARLRAGEVVREPHMSPRAAPDLRRHSHSGPTGRLLCTCFVPPIHRAPLLPLPTQGHGLYTAIFETKLRDLKSLAGMSYELHKGARPIKDVRLYRESNHTDGRAEVCMPRRVRAHPSA